MTTQVLQTLKTRKARGMGWDLVGLPVFFRSRWNKTAIMEAMHATTTPSTVVFFRPILKHKNAGNLLIFILIHFWLC